MKKEILNNFQIPSPLQPLNLKIAKEKEIHLYIKRDDLIHPDISGNKWRKLKFNIEKAQNNNCNTLITFGGAYSNHILATAISGKLYGFKTIGFIRGEEHLPLNPTLQKAQSFGMEFIYVNRSTYRNKEDLDFLKEIQNNYPTAHIVPEGGANSLGIKGCETIVNEINEELKFDYLTVDCGTGATLAGLINSTSAEIIGIPVLKAKDYFEDYIQKHCPLKSNYTIFPDYHFGGYAKWKPELLEFMSDFYLETEIKTDPIYTGKQAYALVDLMKKEYFPKGSTVVFLHTGGLQGIEGFERRFNVKIY